MQNNFYHIGVNPTVDLIIFNPNEEILLIKRSKDSAACPLMYAFPGGFIDTDAKKNSPFLEGLETPKMAAIRELKEETNLSLDPDSDLILVGVYEGNNRDPRDNALAWTKSYVYLFKIDQKLFLDQKNKIKGMDDADEAKWFKIDDLLKMKLAFDHNQILTDVIKLVFGK